MTVGVFTLMDAGLLAHQRAEIIPQTDTLVGVLVLHAHGAPVVATEATYADISADECADGDYGPIVLTSVDVTEPSAGIVMVDAAQVDYGAAVTISARYFYVLRRAGGSLVAGDLILGFMDLNDGGAADVDSIASDFKVDFNASGMYRTTIAP
jgi:hypothetical protein